MKTIKALLLLSVFASAAGCTKDAPVLPPGSTPSIAVPNGDFESWTAELPDQWQTNSCPTCVPAYETYIVRQDSDAYQGQYAAGFIYNNVYRAYAENGFTVSIHPEELKAFVRCSIAANDTVSIRMKLFHNNVEVDNGQWYATGSIANYTQVTIPISQNASQADSAVIRIEGGNVNAYPNPNSWLLVDEMTFN